MGNANFSDEFKRDAVARITERGHRVAEVFERLGVMKNGSVPDMPRRHRRPETMGDALVLNVRAFVEDYAAKVAA